ncbi:MAG: ROK family transcriptional regulator [Gemmatimonadaceae bacterium]|jgi:predicted NBD/HSP70 family sugar kinase|nr:ROK family transcriptional regulator [Gemmatimonadaceae bacterium]
MSHDAILASAPGLTAPARAVPLADAVLRLIWEQQRISRAEIARRADLSRSTVSDIVAALIESGLVAEAGIGESRGGRRPIVLEFQDDAYVILGVDLGASHISVVLTDLRGRILTYERREHPVRTEPTTTTPLVRTMCDAALAAVPRGRQRLVGLGIAVPSPVDPRHPDRLSPLAMPNWGGGRHLAELTRQFDVPVLVDNDANLGALAEHWWGAARGISDFAYIKIATGVGAGHFIDGRIYRGSSGFAGEIGHLAIDPRGEPCVCGNRGCLVTLVGGHALTRRVRELTAAQPSSRLAGVEPSFAAIEEAALANDPVALQVVREAAEVLGIAISGLLNILNPSAVILGGGLARVGEHLLQPLRETVRARAFVSSLASSDLIVSALGNRDVALGAATLVLDAALHDPRLFPTASP